MFYCLRHRIQDRHHDPFGGFLSRRGHKNCPHQSQGSRQAIAHALAQHQEEQSTAGLAAFWRSHVPRSRLRDFLRGFQRMPAPGAAVAFMDNGYAEGSSTPISRTDANGNTYQVRRLSGGSTNEVLKHFPSAPELLAAVASAWMRFMSRRGSDQAGWEVNFGMGSGPDRGRTEKTNLRRRGKGLKLSLKRPVSAKQQHSDEHGRNPGVSVVSMPQGVLGCIGDRIISHLLG